MQWGGGYAFPDEIAQLMSHPRHPHCKKLQICPFIFNSLQDAPPSTLFFSYFCIVAGGWVYPSSGDLKHYLKSLLFQEGGREQKEMDTGLKPGLYKGRGDPGSLDMTEKMAT